MLILSKLSKEDASFQKIRDNNDAPPEWNDVASSQAFLSHSHNQVPLYYTTIHQATDHNRVTVYGSEQRKLGRT